MLYHELNAINKIDLESITFLELVASTKNYFHPIFMKTGAIHLDVNQYECQGWYLSLHKVNNQVKFDTYGVHNGTILDYYTWCNKLKKLSQKDRYWQMKKDMQTLEAIKLLKLPVIQDLEVKGYMKPDLCFHQAIPLNQQLLMRLGILNEEGRLSFDKIIQTRSELESRTDKIEISTLARRGKEKVEYRFNFIVANKKNINLFNDIRLYCIDVSSADLNSMVGIEDNVLPDPETVYQMALERNHRHHLSKEEILAKGFNFFAG
ncbi:hypothetical protein [Chitinophaga pinensis]|uniref:Uncharacterized protein n=1 Tax=Chitinophaga pinensis (strain ATCC 43595 / DSM 2588 / LMG 13176 / NBRC 15968 / NCIMB 11800 / UQM 2034) TaxID=485918 RepID=A0A979G4U2_CHIPD|nr:hypothetical protein [Chitinophaga pinensis]ACU60643.1 hypothetical protein Cpin_3176 [Chitinophaga pinensis DSM 2588]